MVIIGRAAWPLFLATLVFVVVERLFELRRAERNRRRLVRRGAIEHGRAHYPLVVGAHVLFYLAWSVETALRRPSIEATTIAALATFALAQAGRAWVMASLGDRWTTRVLVLPGEPLIRSGPYRLARHPNYVVVVIELAALACAFSAWWSLALALTTQAIVLTIRIRVEERALRSSELGPSSSD